MRLIPNTNQLSGFNIQKKEFTFNLLFSNYPEVIDKCTVQFLIKVMLDDKNIGEMFNKNISCTGSALIDVSLKTSFLPILNLNSTVNFYSMKVFTMICL